MTYYEVQRRRTAGAYIGIKAFASRQAAREHLAKIATETPSYPYDGGDTYKVGTSSHNNIRYRIVERPLN